MVLTGVLFVAVTGIVRYLGSDMNAVQSAFIRYGFGTLLFIPLYWRLFTTRTYPARIRLHMLRGLVHGIGVMLWFGGKDVISGAIRAGDLASFLFYSIIVAGAVGAISSGTTTSTKCARA